MCALRCAEQLATLLVKLERFRIPTADAGWLRCGQIVSWAFYHKQQKLWSALLVIQRLVCPGLPNIRLHGSQYSRLSIQIMTPISWETLRLWMPCLDVGGHISWSSAISFLSNTFKKISRMFSKQTMWIRLIQPAKLRESFAIMYLFNSQNKFTKASGMLVYILRLGAVHKIHQPRILFFIHLKLLGVVLPTHSQAWHFKSDKLTWRWR